MAVGFDTAIESGTWTTTPDPFTFSAAPSGTATGALVKITQSGGSGADDISGVDVGGTTLERIISIGMTTAAEEPGRVYLYFASGSWSGSQTVSIDHNGGAGTKIAAIVYLTGTDLVAYSPQASMSEGVTGAIRSQRIVTPSAGMRFVVGFTGLGSPIMTPLSGMTAISDHDFGNNSEQFARETSTSTDFIIGWSDTGEDAAQAAVAIIEGPVDPVPALYRHQWQTQAVNHIFTMPETGDGDLLIGLFVASNNGNTVTTPSGGWVRADTPGGNSTFLPALFYLECDGTESGNVNIVTSAGTNSQGQFHLWRVLAAIRDTATPPEFTIVGPTASGTPDPGSLSPSWGSEDTYWFVMLCRDAADGITSLGANYDPQFVVDLGTNTALASAWRQNTASSEDPPSSTVDTTDEEFLAITGGVKPFSGTTAVGKEVQVLWDIAAAVGDPIVLRWDIDAHIGDTVQLVWDTLEGTAIGDTVQLIWDIRAAIGDTIQLVWDTEVNQAGFHGWGMPI